MPSTIALLTAIGSTSPISWDPFIAALRVLSEDVGRREVLNSIQALEGMELIAVVRDRNSNEVVTLALTELGVERLSESRESDRLAVERRRQRIESDRVIRRYV